MRVDRFFEARFPGLSFSHIQRIIRKGEVRVNGKRTEPKARLETGTKRAHSAAQARPRRSCATTRRSRSEGPRLSQVDHALRGRRRAGAQQAGRPRRAGRLRHDAPRRRHARRVARPAPATRSVRGWCIGSTRTRPAACWSPRRALPRRRSPRPSARVRRARSIGRWWPACRSRSRAASRPISPSRRSTRTRFMRIAKHGEKDAVHAVTYYAVVETSAQKLAWLSLKPVTGRTHQLRAHMAHVRPPDRRRSEIFQHRELAIAGRHAEQAASAGAPHRGAASARRHHRRHGAAAGRTCSRRGICSGSTPRATTRSRTRRRRSSGAAAPYPMSMCACGSGFCSLAVVLALLLRRARECRGARRRLLDHEAGAGRRPASPTTTSRRAAPGSSVDHPDAPAPDEPRRIPDMPPPVVVPQTGQAYAESAAAGAGLQAKAAARPGRIAPCAARIRPAFTAQTGVTRTTSSTADISDSCVEVTLSPPRSDERAPQARLKSPPSPARRKSARTARCRRSCCRSAPAP